MVFWVIVIGLPIFVGGQVIPVFYDDKKIENVFEGAVKNLSEKSDKQIKVRMKTLLSKQGVDLDALPEEFFENLFVEKENGKVQIGSEYHVVLWLLGEPGIDPEGEYKESEIRAMDKIKLRGRLDFDFAPYSETP